MAMDGFVQKASHRPRIGRSEKNVTNSRATQQRGYLYSILIDRVTVFSIFEKFVIVLIFDRFVLHERSWPVLSWMENAMYAHMTLLQQPCPRLRSS